MSFYLKDYKIIKQIGKGAFGKVFLVQDKNENEFALKEIELKNLDQNTKQNIIFENGLCKLLNHKNITKCFDSLLQNDILYLLFEYANGGDLYGYKLSENEIKDMAKDILSALEYCHSMNICHTDLHSGNILVFIDKKEKKHFKLADWGMSEEKTFSATNFSCDKSDIYTFGNIVFSTLLSGKINNPDAINFIKKLKSRNNTPSASEALQDEWLKNI